MDTKERFDVIVVGGGPAGAAAAYRLAQEKVKVLLVERGHHSGSKNMMGGRIYTHSLEMLIPDFRERAPLERKVTKERISIGTSDEMTTMEYARQGMKPSEESYVVLRSKFDQWLVKEAESQGALVISNMVVDELLLDTKDRDGNNQPRVIGIRCGADTVYADLVIIAEGTNTLLLEQAKLGASPNPHHMAVGVKETFTLSKDIIEDRLGLLPDQGMAWLMVGDMTDGLLGGGFVYTNKTSVSVGVVVGLDSIGMVNSTVEDMLVKFEDNPIIRPLLKGGKLVEHSAHMVPEGGYQSMPRLGGLGYIVVGDAARMCMNLGYTIRGMDLAIGSGHCGAEAYLVSARQGKLDDIGVVYKKFIDASWIGKDLKLYQNVPHFLGSTPRIFKEYPTFVNDIMSDVFTVNSDGATSIMKKLWRRMNEVGMVQLGKDALKGVRSL